MRTGERNTFDSVVGRAAALLGAFDARHLSMGVSELSRRSGLPKSTTARLAAELTTHGFLEKAEGTDLKLGTKLFELGELASRQRKLREVALPYMADLRQVSRQTVHLAVLVDTDVMYVEIVRSRDAPRMPSEVGGRLPGARRRGRQGTAGVLAGRASCRRSSIAGCRRSARGRSPLPGCCCGSYAGSGSPVSPTRARNPPTGSAARPVPILGPDGRPVAAMSISGWSGTLDLRRVGPAVKTAALALSRDLQLRGPARAPSWAVARP